MSIDEARGRIVTFVVISPEPLKRQAVRNWFRYESPSSIATRLRLTDPWQLHQFHFEGDRIAWNHAGGVHAWRRLAPSEYPDWLEGRLAKDNAKMDEAEKCA